MHFVVHPGQAVITSPGILPRCRSAIFVKRINFPMEYHAGRSLHFVVRPGQAVISSPGSAIRRSAEKSDQTQAFCGPRSEKMFPEIEYARGTQNVSRQERFLTLPSAPDAASESGETACQTRPTGKNEPARENRQTRKIFTSYAKLFRLPFRRLTRIVQ